jgi:sugar lactone lactonase YvrE
MRNQLKFIFSAVLFVAFSLNSSAGIITPYAGGGTNGNFSNTIGFPATNAAFPGIQGVAVDLVGNLYIAHGSGARVLRVDPTNGFITSFAGTGVLGNSGDGGLATDAQLDLPESVAVDLAGNVFVVDEMENRMRKIDAATGLITTVAGGAFGYAGNGGPATNAALAVPQGVALDIHGNLYIADTQYLLIRKVNATNGANDLATVPAALRT